MMVSMPASVRRAAYRCCKRIVAKEGGRVQLLVKYTGAGGCSVWCQVTIFPADRPAMKSLAYKAAPGAIALTMGASESDRLRLKSQAKLCKLVQNRFGPVAAVETNGDEGHDCRKQLSAFMHVACRVFQAASGGGGAAARAFSPA
jgi:hypothetical protein